jgi:hypothetical protein
VRWNPPAGVNTPAWEYRPTASGAWILFGRLRTATHRRQIILFDRFSQQVIVLADRPAGPGNPSATPGEVNGDFAVWSQCTATACNVWEYDITTAMKTRLPNATPGHYNYAASVDTAGTVYFAHGGRTCGGARIEKQPLNGAAATIWPLRLGATSPARTTRPMSARARSCSTPGTAARPARTTSTGSLTRDR